jgi:hypothetical protein
MAKLKVKRLVPFVKKYHFWIICASIAIIALGSWTKAAIFDLSKQFKTALGKNVTNYNAMKGIADNEKFPAEKAIKAIQNKTEKLKVDVANAWSILYDQQKQQNPLPEALLNLKDIDFKKAFDDALTDPKALTRNHCYQYQDKIRDEIPKLFSMIGVVRGDPSSPDMRGGPLAGRGGAISGIVEWDDGQCQNIEKRFKWTTPPNPREVLLAQEELWVYKALLEVIKNTNADAKSRGLAAVRKIEILKIAREVFHDRSAIDPSLMAGAAPSAPGVPGAPAGEQNKPESILLADRYVDEEGKPLGAGEPSPYEEFRLMPYVMRVVIDQRKIPLFLAECAKSSLLIDIRQLNFKGAGSPPAAEIGPAAGGLGRGAQPQRNTADKVVISTDVTLDVRGAVYIFNPPGRKIQILDAADQGQPAEPPPETAEIPGATTEPPADAGSLDPKTDATPADGGARPAPADSTDRM